jgi:hypothetical protein
LRFRQAQAEGNVSADSQTASTARRAASFHNPCDNADFVAPVWQIAGLPRTTGDEASTDTTITDSANGYGVRCAWDSQSVSTCKVIAAATGDDAEPSKRMRQAEVALAGTKLLSHGFWVEAVGANVDNPATYNLMEEWLCGNVDGSYP